MDIIPEDQQEDFPDADESDEETLMARGWVSVAPGILVKRKTRQSDADGELVQTSGWGGRDGARFSGVSVFPQRVSTDTGTHATSQLERLRYDDSPHPVYRVETSHHPANQCAYRRLRSLVAYQRLPSPEPALFAVVVCQGRPLPERVHLLLRWRLHLWQRRHLLLREREQVECQPHPLQERVCLLLRERLHRWQHVRLLLGECGQVMREVCQRPNYQEPAPYSTMVFQHPLLREPVCLPLPWRLHLLQQVRQLLQERLLW